MSRFVRKRRYTLLESFTYAFEGVLHVFRAERNMRIHTLVAVIMLVGALFYNLNRFEMIVLLLTISLVFLAEMVNTAVEAAMDAIDPDINPLAKVAKDVAAGAVLIASATAVLVGYLLFYDRINEPTGALIIEIQRSPIHLAIIAFVLVLLATISLKVYFGGGTFFKGGMPSGHAAAAFSAWVAITFVAIGTPYGVPISGLSLFLALLVAQSRVDSGVHTVWEVTAGGLLGSLLTLVLFQLWS